MKQALCAWFILLLSSLGVTPPCIAGTKRKEYVHRLTDMSTAVSGPFFEHKANIFDANFT